MNTSRKRPYADAEAQSEYHDAHPKPKRQNTSEFRFHSVPHNKVPPSNLAIDPTLDVPRNMAASSNHDMNQFFLSGPGLEGPKGPRPDYPRQIHDLDPLTQDPQSISAAHHEPEPNPSLNSYPEPWNQQFINGGPFQCPTTRSYSRRMNHPVPRPQMIPYSASEIDCSASGRYPPDSGYYTKSPASLSIFSGDFPTSSQRSLTGAMNAMELPNEQMLGLPYSSEGFFPFSQEAQRSYPEHQVGSSAELTCTECVPPTTLRNKSELTKHTLRHKKPYKCDLAGCNRTEGFTTKNDLDRHKKSLHQVHIGKSYMCAAPHCAKKNKIWPRADNFRQHILRLHRDCNVQELMDKSWERGCAMTQADFKRDFVNSLDLCQQSIYEDVFATEHDVPNLVTLQEIDNSSAVETISNPYPQEREYSSATSQDSAKMYNLISQDVEEHRNTNQEALNHCSPINISDDNLTPEGSEQCPATPNKPPVPSNRKQPLVHHPNDFPDGSTWTNAQGSQASEANASRTFAISADEASQTIASDLFKAQASCRSQEELELAIKSSVLSLLSANKSRKRSLQDSPPRELTDPGKRLECQYCHKKKKTQCDLTKHLKRHTRPYGCTYANCSRRFGSKNDWKRHENSRHYQIETWKCAERVDPSGCDTARGKDPGTVGTTSHVQCGRLYYRDELFKKHLEEDHQLAGLQHQERVEDQCKKRRVGRNGQCGFWCGFCQTVVQLEKIGPEAWDERFNHIDDEHFKKGIGVEDWLPLEGQVPRSGSGFAEMCDPEKEAREAEEKGSDEEDSGPDAQGDGDVIVLEAGGFEEVEARAKAANAARARRRSNAAGPEGKEKVRRLWDCCRCHNVELSRDIHVTCYLEGCNHNRCGLCRSWDRREANVLENDHDIVNQAPYAL